MKQPSYFQYKGHHPFIKFTLENKKIKTHVRIFVWRSRKEMQDIVATKKQEKIKRLIQAAFNNKSEEKGEWIGDISFNKQSIKIEDIAHEVVHVVQRFFRMRNKRLSGRTEELFAGQVGELTRAIYSQLVAKGVTIK